jgi:hypothetical protein
MQCLVVEEKEMELLKGILLTVHQSLSDPLQKCGKTHCLCIPAKQG